MEFNTNAHFNVSPPVFITADGSITEFHNGIDFITTDQSNYDKTKTIMSTKTLVSNISTHCVKHHHENETLEGFLRRNEFIIK